MATADLPVDSIANLLHACAEYMDGSALETVRRAYTLAERAHRGTPRLSGEPYIEHPVAVALWLAERHVTADCIAAALLHDVVEDTPVSLQRLQNQFGPVVAALVDGVTKFDAVEIGEIGEDVSDEVSRKREQKRRQQAETLRKLFLKMAEDPRTALIKIADRLHNLHTLDAMRPEKQAAKARETLEIYVPLAGRLGMGEAKYEMEDLALRYIDPRRYAWLRDQIARETAARSDRTRATVHALRRVLMQHGIAAEVTPHVKHLFSVHRRMLETGNETIGEMSDFVTYLVLVDTNHDCYGAMYAIHSQWQQIDRRVRDYIGAPKLNGYQSLHTTVFGFVGFEDPFDVHIRTHQMQQIADSGPVLLAAARPGGWQSRDRSQAWIDQVRAWQQELSLSATDLVDAVRGDLFQNQIFIFTPKGEIKDVPEGSTVLDFAFRIHTEVGQRCVGARVTGHDNIARIEGRDYVVQDRDTVNVLVEDDVRPDASWLRSAHTHHAQDAILHYLRLNGLPTETEDHDDDPLPASQIASVRLGGCCEPTPDDELIGIAVGKRLVVHRVECRYAQEMLAPTAAPLDDAPRAWYHVRWETIRPERYRISLLLQGRDRSGLMHDIAEVLAQYDLNMVNLGALSISTRYKAIIRVTLEVKRPDQLQRAIQRLLNVDGIVSVERRQRVPRPTDHVALAR
jgi:guanosine-3',5'-bis(diphosphate) 3'-pyrophosphohydrolase